MKHLPKIIISSVPHNKQRYPTAGDYFKKSGDLQIRVSKMNANHEFLVVLHEFIEWYLIEQEGITIDEIDKFDIEFEKKRKKGNRDEPGDSKDAPYHKQHRFATMIEQQLASYLDVDWDKYDKYVNGL